jgi:DNA-binding transcriptional LysR family regulator
LAARGAGKSLAGRLRVTGAVTFTRIHLMPRLPEFLQRHPDLEIEVVLDDRKLTWCKKESMWLCGWDDS